MEQLIDGLSTDKQYYVSVIDKDQFKLAAVGVGTTVSSSILILDSLMN